MNVKENETDDKRKLCFTKTYFSIKYYVECEKGRR